MKGGGGTGNRLKAETLLGIYYELLRKAFGGGGCFILPIRVKNKTSTRKVNQRTYVYSQIDNP